jgi:hypothetical protein
MPGQSVYLMPCFIVMAGRAGHQKTYSGVIEGPLSWGPWHSCASKGFIVVF